jgi:hypothetical protein
MRIYWRGKGDFPELAGLSLSQRFKAWQTCYWKFSFRYRQCRVALLVFVASIVLGVIVGDTLRYVFGLPSVVQYACWFIGAEAGILIYRNVLIDRLRPHLRDYVEKGHI